MEEKKIKVRIKPGHGIGGVGNAGDVVWMSAADAEMYVLDGYVELLTEDGGPLHDPSPSTVSGLLLSAQDEGLQEDHKIMKPQSKRRK